MTKNNITEQDIDDFKEMMLLEYFGIHIEDIKEGSNPFTEPLKCYFSVPESSTLEVETVGEESNKLLKTSDGLIAIAKGKICRIMTSGNEEVFSDEELEEAKIGNSKYIKFFAKIRTGEVWNKELADKAIKDLADSMRVAAGYKEV